MTIEKNITAATKDFVEKCKKVSNSIGEIIKNYEMEQKEITKKQELIQKDSDRDLVFILLGFSILSIIVYLLSLVK